MSGPGRERGGRRACPIYRPDDPSLVLARIPLGVHVNACPDWHQDGAEELRVDWADSPLDVLAVKLQRLLELWDHDSIGGVRGAVAELIREVDDPTWQTVWRQLGRR